ncbi:MAG: hypothetical protein V1846_00235 [Candidatus Komeilibacteria bacterium]
MEISTDEAVLCVLALSQQEGRSPPWRLVRQLIGDFLGQDPTAGGLWQRPMFATDPLLRLRQLDIEVASLRQRGLLHLGATAPIVTRAGMELAARLTVSSDLRRLVEHIKVQSQQMGG